MRNGHNIYFSISYWSINLKYFILINLRVIQIKDNSNNLELDDKYLHSYWNFLANWSTVWEIKLRIQVGDLKVIML